MLENKEKNNAQGSIWNWSCVLFLGKEEEARVHQHMQMVAQKQVRFSSPAKKKPFSS